MPAGMTALVYPEWASAADPDIPRQLTTVAVRLYELFGSGDPAASALPEFPFSTATGQGSGIDAYDNLKRDFQRIESEFDAAAQAFKSAVQDSAYRTRAGRDAINNAIATFNSTAEALDSGDWDGLLQAESTMLATVKTEVSSAAQAEPVPLPPGEDTPPAIPLPGIDTPPAGTPPAAPAAKEPNPGSGGLADLLSTLGGGAPLLGAGGGLPMGGNPMAGLGGLMPQNAAGAGMPAGGRGASPPSARADEVEPLTLLEEAGDDDTAAPIAPLNQGPQNPPPPPPAPAAPAEAAGTELEQPGVAAAGHTVTLPDGATVEAPNKQAAEAAQNAIDTASPGGDAAQKAYSPTGLQLPEEGKNLGAKVDPSDMQPGDVLKWQDKTMVAVAPGLVADPTQPGVTHTLEDVLKDQRGFQGVFRPTVATPPPTAPAAPPPGAAPRSEVPPAPSATVPQPAPPSPFENLV